MNPQELIFACTCGQLAPYEQSYAGDGVSAAHLDVYRCPSGHIVQVLYPVLFTAPPQRRKPETRPPFPGSW
jgi:hypothetical protein